MSKAFWSLNQSKLKKNGMNKCEGLTEWNKMTLSWTCEMEAIVSVDRSRWSRCCNIISTVSTCWNMAAASLQATALQHIRGLNVARMDLVFLQWLTLSPLFCHYDTWIPILLCHKDVFYSVHLLLDYTLYHLSEVFHISHFLKVRLETPVNTPQGFGQCWDHVTNW